MAQFSVYRNSNPATRANFPFLLDVQADLLRDLGTRVVVPMCSASSMKGKLVRNLMPTFAIEGKQFAMLTPQLAGLSTKLLGPKVSELSDRRAEIVAALDLLITGI
jgi:toxin CcdB